MDSPRSDPSFSLLVSPAELHNALTNSSCSSRRIIPLAVGRKSHIPSYEAQHIPGSIFIDLDEMNDATSQYPQMLPTPAHFAHCMTGLGIHPTDVLVVYDTLEVGLYSSPRVAWMCRYFGHGTVHVLNNFPSYVEAGHPVAVGPLSTPVPALEAYPTREPRAPTQVISFEELQDFCLGKSEQRGYRILDARIPGRFSGAEAEIDPTLRSGHMPCALNVPFASILSPDKTILPAADLRLLFGKIGVHEAQPLVLTCNSGVTAAALDLALNVAGYKMERRLYDGSWMEWTRRADKDGLILVD
ncbi:hypothetical protein ARAM_003541 [Aspergillus rambellii]|uniref:Rhodanese domain-containing protein n=1 Tax=Aspergillus rambellii TaxID=308745 RepID=A0A0F8X8Q1_9EURO|nr:hypothetical protein ARAM_003541 [Aspergillus rambellii]